MDRWYRRSDISVCLNGFDLPNRYRPDRYLFLLQTQVQVIIDNAEYSHEILTAATIQSEYFAHEIKTVSAVIVIAEIFHFETAAPGVVINIARGLRVSIKRIQEVFP